MSIVAVKHYIGHADVDPTMRYVHYKSRAGEAAGKLVAAGVERNGAELAAVSRGFHLAG